MKNTMTFEEAFKELDNINDNKKAAYRKFIHKNDANIVEEDFDENKGDTSPVLKRLKDNRIDGGKWYTEYFAVQPGIVIKNKVKTAEDYDDYDDFEVDLANPANKIIPVLFGPNLTRNTDIESFDKLEDALNNVLDFIGSEYGCNNIDDMLETCLLDGDKIIDNSITVQTETNVDTQDIYGTFMRISQNIVTAT